MSALVKSLAGAVLVRNTDSESPGSAGSGQARWAIFENQNRTGRHSEPFGRQAINLRVGLAAGHVFRRKDELKSLQQAVLC